MRHETKRTVVILDEFQDVLNINEAQEALALLRGSIQFQTNIPYIFICESLWSVLSPGDRIGQEHILEALGLNAGIVGAFEDRKVIDVLGIPEKHEPLLIMPVGYRG